jgi:hypothetical protein
MANSKTLQPRTFEEQIAEANKASVDVKPVIQADAAIRTGSCVLWVITDIKPIKKEIEAVGVTLGDPRNEVPWLAGCTINLLAIRSRQPNGVDVREMIKFSVNPENEDDPIVEFPNSSRGMKQWVTIMADSLAMGRVRFTAKEGEEYRTIKPGLPEAWDALQPFERFAYYLKVFSQMLGIPAGQVNIGTTFYTFINSYKDKNNNWHTDKDVVFKNSDGIILYAPHLVNPSLVGSYDMRVVRKALAMMELEREARQLNDASFNPNAFAEGQPKAPWNTDEVGF